MKMRSSYIFCLLAMCYIAYAVSGCPNGGMKMKIPSVRCQYYCVNFITGDSLHREKDNTPCTGPGLPNGICMGGECKEKNKY
uniref:Putative salivary secreted protein n=1 Tax=Ixodes ricinus TaxID=34613 RepID=A0A6B0U6V5_IXORI